MANLVSSIKVTLTFIKQILYYIWCINLFGSFSDLRKRPYNNNIVSTFNLGEQCLRTKCRDN